MVSIEYRGTTCFPFSDYATSTATSIIYHNHAVSACNVQAVSSKAWNQEQIKQKNQQMMRLMHFGKFLIQPPQQPLVCKPRIGWVRDTSLSLSQVHKNKRKKHLEKLRK